MRTGRCGLMRLLKAPAKEFHRVQIQCAGNVDKLYYVNRSAPHQNLVDVGDLHGNTSREFSLT